MGLKGTIRDFGVADIFQLIGQQAKTGVLVLNNDVDEVRVYFKDGSVVRAENASRPGQMLLGNFMVRAAVLTQRQVDAAVKEQKRSLKRIGAVFIDLGYATAEQVTEFATLQMTETVYALFEWVRGTYEFDAIPVEPSPEGVEPIRAESIVMNGIRMMDEWPEIREQIPSYALYAELAKSLPSPRREATNNLGISSKASEPSADLADIGPSEREVYELVRPERTIREVIDLSRLGEFEACRALSVLVTAGYVRLVEPSEGSDGLRGATVSLAVRVRTIAGAITRIALSAGLVFVGAALVHSVLFTPRVGGGDIQVERRKAAHYLAISQMRVIRRALEVYRLETGNFPDSLESLVDAKLVGDRDIRYPFSNPYYYQVHGETVVVLPPIH